MGLEGVHYPFLKNHNFFMNTGSLVHDSDHRASGTLSLVPVTMKDKFILTHRPGLQPRISQPGRGILWNIHGIVNVSRHSDGNLSRAS